MSEATINWTWMPYPGEGLKLYDVLVVGSVQRFHDDGPFYGAALEKRTGAMSTDTAARERVEREVQAAMLDADAETTSGSPELDAQISDAMQRFSALSEEDQQALRAAQRENWAQAEAKLDCAQGAAAPKQERDDAFWHWLRGASETHVPSLHDAFFAGAAWAREGAPAPVQAIEAVDADAILSLLPKEL